MQREDDKPNRIRIRLEAYEKVSRPFCFEEDLLQDNADFDVGHCSASRVLRSKGCPSNILGNGE